jgi:hypothetical protein
MYADLRQIKYSETGGHYVTRNIVIRAGNLVLLG